MAPPDPFWRKRRTPEILAYRRRIGLTTEDLLDLAEHSESEGADLRRILASGDYTTSAMPHSAT